LKLQQQRVSIFPLSTFLGGARINHRCARETPQCAYNVRTMMNMTEKSWLADRLRELAAEEALAGAHDIAAEYLFRAEAVERSVRHQLRFDAPLFADA
jgi:hypothetical protein